MTSLEPGLEELDGEIDAAGVIAAYRLPARLGRLMDVDGDLMSDGR
jgi:hypothetical protein